MRPMRNGGGIGGGNLTEKQSKGGLEHVQEVWGEWEIQCLILLSLSLQVFLYLTADLRRRSARRSLRMVQWLAYLSADTVAVFALGHLAVHAQGPGHELMFFWAPFVLVHLGGQDNITAFSKQDNELWPRHLLNLVTQAAVAGYVVSKSSWPDARLRAAMVLMFFSGFLKYAGRTYCLYSASPRSLGDQSRVSLWETIVSLREERERRLPRQQGPNELLLKNGFEQMFIAGKLWESIRKNAWVGSADDIMSVDAPVNDVRTMALAAFLPGTLEEYKNRQDRWIAYQDVAACLVQSYQYLYTKAPLSATVSVGLKQCSLYVTPTLMKLLIIILPFLTYSLFHSISAVIALVLFFYAEKEGHHSKVDVTVSYILLAGAIVLDLLPALTSIFSYARRPFRPRTALDCANMCLMSCVQPPGWRRTTKQWSEQLAQYSMITRYTSSMPSLVKWIGVDLGASWCLELFELTRIRVTDDLKLVVLDKLFLEARREMWDIASFRGERALGQHWHQVFPESERPDSALHKSISSKVDFPTSVLIWHIATDICYFVTEDNDTEPAEIKKKKNSRELSHYIMYLVFKCDVMLTSSSRLVHQKAHEGLAKLLPAGQQSTIGEKEAVIQVFGGIKKEEQQQGSSPLEVVEGKKNEESANNAAAAAASTSSQIKELLRSTEEALYSPVLPDAREVAQELIDIEDEAQRWQLILEVWLEMLFYTAPRCGAAFHYEHLSTGGEFISHVLLLMRALGPFLPKPGS